ncbi:dual specificity protein phosphatase family protein [Pseudomonas sp. KNUC1026]|uniref:dual specificity protein phosphatase family protein n=1 Tax=Pseudomonas sp. KNUC1026 TaxID=2893890 RepID=UPI001F40F2B8|nr:dual specificity protein phosphatase family protein [Pseudomonas sp. KNUC1026]UFH48844.1 dual specificity protein phosphatase family protein [Pseudomonas sp. KNUC1026]
MQATAFFTRRRAPLLAIAALLVAALVGASLAGHHRSRAQAAAPVVVSGPAHHTEWARSVDPSINLFQMSPVLYRSGLPSDDRDVQLKALGVRSVVSFIKDDDREWVKDPSIRLYSQPMHADRVTDDEILQALRTVRAAQAQGPVLIHCKHGNNRTGIVAAMYRITFDGWSREAALAEMQNNGFGSEDDMTDAVEYLEQADVDAIRVALANGSPCAHGMSWCGVKEQLGML